MRLPRYSELDNKQRDVWDYPLDEPLFVAGPPGSGKTVLAVQRAQMLAQLQAPVIVVTYNRMLRRLLRLMSTGDGVRSYTMHKFVGRDYSATTGNALVPHEEYDSYAYQWTALLSNLDTVGIQRAEPCVVDEAQDLPEGFFLYASRRFARPLTVFTDEDQALSNTSTTLEQIKEAGRLADPILLAHNHRNSPEIARVAEYFHTGRLPAAVVRRTATGEKPRLICSPTVAATARRIGNWCRSRGGSIGAIVYKNETGRCLADLLREILPDTRVDVYSDQNEETINVLDDGVTIVNRKSVKGQEFDTAFILELEHFIPCASAREKRTMYMMCSRARDYLFLVYGANGLSFDAVSHLPGPDMLERP